MSLCISSIKSEVKETLVLGAPLIASQLIYACSGFIGTALVADLGQDALAASVLVTMMWMTLSVFFFGILNSVSVLVSHHYAAKNYDNISVLMGQALRLGLILCVCIILILICMPTVFVHFTKQPPAVIKLALEYMYALLFTIPGLVCLIIYEQFLSGISKVKLVLRISFLVVPIEISLIYCLIFGKFGFPKCGIAGIGYGFAITYTSFAVGLMLYLWKSKTYQHFKIFNGIFTNNLMWMKEFLRVGLPMGCMHVIEVSTFTLGTFWIAQFGTTVLAAHQIVLQYLGFAITLVFAMAQAVTIRVGYAVGRENMQELRYAVFVGMCLNTFCVLIIALAFNWFPKIFLSLDLDITAAKNIPLMQDASLLLSIVGVLLIFDNIRLIGFGALRGLKDTKFSMYTSFFAFWICGTSAAYLLGFYYQLNAKGIWWGMTFGIICGAVIVVLRIFYLLDHIDFKKILAVKSS